MPPKIELSVHIAGKVADRLELPARKLKILMAEVAPDASTNAERGKALVEWIVRRLRTDLKDEAVQLGSRQCDKMQEALKEAGDEWPNERILKAGTDAFEAAYDALP